MRLERESEGIYKYGMKRVFIKIENDSIIIRVGGGFMNIDQFVEQYCNPNGGGLSDNAAVMNSTLLISDQHYQGGNGGGSASKQRVSRYQYAGVVNQSSRGNSNSKSKRRSSGGAA